MGGEILAITAAAVGLILFVFLVFRSLYQASRPYSLPTLVLSLLGGGYAAIDSTGSNLMWNFFIGFAIAAPIFGTQAHLIYWLRERK
jgi:hypothetical protein